MIIILILIIIYGYFAIVRFRKKLIKETKEAEDVLRRNISVIRNEVEKGEPRDKISKDLKGAEKRTEKEIKDIEEI